MITMLGLFIVVTYVEQRLIVLPNTAGKKELYGSNPCLYRISSRLNLNTLMRHFALDFNLRQKYNSEDIELLLKLCGGPSF